MKCSHCQNLINCSANTSCWCTTLPALLPPDPNATCLCPDCLTAKIALVVNTNPAHLTSKENEQIKALGTPIKLNEGVDYYIIKGGLMVFTSWYHLRKGYCCDNDCKHCPYQDKKDKKS